MWECCIVLAVEPREDWVQANLKSGQHSKLIRNVARGIFPCDFASLWCSSKAARKYSGHKNPPATQAIGTAMG